MDYEEIRYALNKQVGYIAWCAVFDTDYGDLKLSGDDARKIALLVEKILLRKLKQAAKREGIDDSQSSSYISPC